MPTFSVLDYLLIILAITCHYPYGRRFGLTNFFTASLVGLTLSGLIIGTLANFSAGLIRPTIIILIAGGALLAIFDLKRAGWKIRLNQQSRKIYLLLVIVGIFIFLLNNPAKVFLARQGDTISVLFNRHYSYYSSQSTEMLNANYNGRLKIPNLEPYQWSRYHFFNSGARSASMGLIKTPGLFSYWIAQTVLAIFVLLSLAESFLFYFGTKPKTILALGAWLAIGFTVFANSITWNFTTTGLFSIFAMAQLIISAHQKKWREALLFTLILGASAFRMMPITLILIFFIVRLLANSTSSLRQQLAPKIIDIAMIAIFAIYNIATIIGAKDSGADEATTLIAKKLFDHSWMFVLSAYKFLGLAEWFVFKEHTEFVNFRNLNYFSKVLTFHSLWQILVASMALLSLVAFYYLIKIIIEKRRLIARYSLLIIFVVLHLFFIPVDLALFYKIVLPYLVISLILIYQIGRKPGADAQGIKLVTLVLIFGTIALNFVGLPFSAKGPATFITLDVALWTVLGIYLLTFTYKKPVFFSTMALALIALATLNFSLIGSLAISDQDNHFYKSNITPLVASNFNRSDFVSSNGFAKTANLDPDTVDVYSSILGAKVELSGETKKFLNNSFIGKKDD